MAPSSCRAYEDELVFEEQISTASERHHRTLHRRARDAAWALVGTTPDEKFSDKAFRLDIAVRISFGAYIIIVFCKYFWRWHLIVKSISMIIIYLYIELLMSIELDIIRLYCQMWLHSARRRCYEYIVNDGDISLMTEISPF